MRILHLLSQTELTGAEVYAQNLIQSQVASGHSVFVISDKMHVKIPVPLTSQPISTNRFFQRMKNIFFLRSFLKDHKIDVIHCHSRGAVRHGFWARAWMPVALVTSLHGRQHFSWSKRFLNIYGEILIAICENVKRAMELDFNMSGSHIRVLRNPVSTDGLKKPELSKRSPHLALLGRSSGPKGERFEQIALNCFEPWLQKIPGLQITVCAPKPEIFSAKFHVHIRSLALKFPNQVQVLGAVPNLKEKLAEFDLTVCSGRIAIESLLSSVPVFALGEYSAHGIVTQKNLKDVLISNFGDIGSAEVEIPLDLRFIRESIQNFLLGERLSSEEFSQVQKTIQREFDPQAIHLEILEVYRAAIFKRHVRKWIPILMYHKIPLESLNSRHRIFVVRDQFRKHLEFFKSRGFQTLSFSELKKFWSGEKSYKEFPRKPLLLTFDDGYKDNLTNAEPLLKEFEMKATIFVLGNHQILENTWDASTGEKPYELMSFEEKKKLDPQVWEIGSHGFDHLHLTQVPPEAAYREIEKSKLSLEKDFSRQITCFAYPFGSTSAEIAEFAKKAGYAFAVNTDQGGLHLADQPHSLFRVNIFPEDGPFQLWKKTSSWYRKYFYRKRKR